MRPLIPYRIPNLPTTQFIEVKEPIQVPLNSSKGGRRITRQRRSKMRRNRSTRKYRRSYIGGFRRTMV